MADELTPVFYELLRRALPGIAIELEGELIQAAPVDTGRLRNSIRVKVVGMSLLISGTNYMADVEFGSPPHEIRPKSKKALKFSIDGSEIFAKVVQHPGNAPNPFIRTTIRKKLPGIVVRNLQRVAK